MASWRGTDLHASVDVMRHAYPARQSAGVVRAKDAVLAFAEASAENEFRKAVWLTDQWRRTTKMNEVLFSQVRKKEGHDKVALWEYASGNARLLFLRPTPAHGGP